MNDIAILYNEFIKIPFPDNLGGQEIIGIDLILLDNDTAGLIDKFISYKGQLNNKDFDILKQCYNDLKIVVRELKGLDRQYFATWLNIANRTIDFLSTTNRLIDNDKDEQLIKSWKKDYKKIKDILNDWDPLGVADSVDDEYDSINFLAYSALINNGGLDDIKLAIKKYLNESMEIDISDNKLTEIAQKIKEIK